MSFCGGGEPELLQVRAELNGRSDVLEKFSSRLFQNHETGSRVLMSNPHIVWLAQLVTREAHSAHPHQ
ncbi:MAG: hypothetical protein ACAH17_02920, partial [Candidatus Paceibacterota bacterium]